MKLNTIKILKEMVARGLVIEDLAEKIGKKPPALYALLSKKTTTLKTISLIGEALDIDPKDLLT